MLVETEHSKQLPNAETDRAEIIKAVIEEIRPNLQRDGGDCQLIEIDGNKIMVKLTGACGCCPMSQITLKMAIEKALKEAVPEIEKVEAV